MHHMCTSERELPAEVSNERSSETVRSGQDRTCYGGGDLSKRFKSANYMCISGPVQSAHIVPVRLVVPLDALGKAVRSNR